MAIEEAVVNRVLDRILKSEVADSQRDEQHAAIGRKLGELFAVRYAKLQDFVKFSEHLVGSITTEHGMQLHLMENSHSMVVGAAKRMDIKEFREARVTEFDDLAARSKAFLRGFALGVIQVWQQVLPSL